MRLPVNLEFSNLKDDALDESIHRRSEKLAGALEAPQHNATLAEDGEEVQHVDSLKISRRGSRK
jgi:hypothetical protein